MNSFDKKGPRFAFNQKSGTAAKGLPRRRLLNRREFLVAGLGGLGWLASRSGPRGGAAEPGTPNPFAYDLSRFSKTDPKRIAYEEVGRWKSPHDDARKLAMGPDETLYVCSGNYVTAMSRDGTRGIEIAVNAPARCVIAANDGALYVGLRDHIEIFDSKGRPRAAWGSLDKKAWLTSLAVGEKDLFAADAGNRVILRYDRSGKLLSRIGEKNKERNIPGFIIPSPYFDVAIHRDGLLRVNNPGRHRVETYTFEGDFEGAWGKPSAALDGFCGCCNPIHLALLSDGKFVTCEKGLPRVKVYGADGEFESVVAGTESFPENAKVCAGLGPDDCTRGGMDAAVDSQGRIYLLDFIAGDVRVMRKRKKAE